MSFLYDRILAIIPNRCQVQIGSSSVNLNQKQLKSSPPVNVFLAIFQDSSKSNEYYILLRTNCSHRLVKKVALQKPVTIDQLNLGTYIEITELYNNSASTGLAVYRGKSKTNIKKIQSSEQNNTVPPPFPDWGNVVGIIDNSI